MFIQENEQIPVGESIIFGFVKDEEMMASKVSHALIAMMAFTKLYLKKII
jgi:hypothetical protein